MSETFAREILRRNVAQICQTIGWNGINSTPLDILVHVLEKYITSLGTQANRYAEQFNRTEPNLHDLGLVFRDLHVQLPELAEYTRCVPPVPPPVSVDKFPKAKESNLNFLKPGSHEVVTRPMHVHEHLPPMYPERERDTPVVAGTVEIHQNGIDNGDSNNACPSPEISVTDSPEKPKDLFKRPVDPVSLPNSKRPRFRIEEEERTREISSVMMTMSGFLSPAREGKLPEARPPTIIADKQFDKHKANSHANSIKVPMLEKSDKKAKKNKLLNGKVMKSKRKDKSHKNESNKSKDSKSSKNPPGLLGRSRDGPHPAIHPLHKNHVSIPASRLLSAPVPQKTVMPPLALVQPHPEPVRPVVKQEPLDSPPSRLQIQSSTAIPVPVEDAIPVPRKIPISRSPLVMNSVTVNKQPLNVHPLDVEIKKEVLEEEKLASQPDRSKINIFKRISNKSKEDRSAPEVVQDKLQSENMISRLQNSAHEHPTENRNYENVRVKTEQSIVNNNDNSALDYSRVIDLRTNEVISIDDDSMDTHIAPSQPLQMEPRPSISCNKTLQVLNSKDIASVSPKIKKEKKHKDKKDKAAKLEAKLLKKQQQQQLAFNMQAEKQNLKLSKPPKARQKPKTEGKVPHMPPGFPFFPAMPGRGQMPGPGLIPNPGLISNEFLAGLANNPALRGLPSPNLLTNPFALGAATPGLIPGPSFLHTGLPNPLLMGNFPHTSRAMKIPPMLRRPSLEVIAVDHDDRRPRDKDRPDKHKAPTIPNILQKHKKPKDQKTNLYKMPPVQPDITIELNPPKADGLRRDVPLASPPQPQRQPTPAPAPAPNPALAAATSGPSPAPPPPQPTAPESSSTPVKAPRENDTEKKKDKTHKKEKKERDGIKLKKKKEKKDKSERKRERDETKEKIKKEKKEKKRERDGLVPKLTLKLGSGSNSNSPLPPSSPDVYKLNIKPVKREAEEPEMTQEVDGRASPELAQIAALVTRPPPSPRRSRPPSAAKYRRIMFKPLKREPEPLDEEPEKSAPAPAPAVLPTPFYVDEHGNKIWVCPACGRPDNGSPMIGCDGCDGWYHWVCVGITEEPGATEDWFCRACVAKRSERGERGERAERGEQPAAQGPPGQRRRGRKPKAERPAH